MSSGIYKITNTVNGKIYVGSSKVLEERWSRHVRELKQNIHHNIHLQRAWNKYGEENFSFDVLEVVESDLLVKEQYWIDKLNPAYNIGSVGGGDNVSKHPKNKEFRELQSKLAKEKYQKLSAEDKSKLAMFGADNPNWKGGTSKKYCECGRRMSLTVSKCQKCKDFTGENNSFYGKHHSEETLKKLRNNNKGVTPANAHKVCIHGVTYKSKAEAARILNVSHSLISYRFKKKYKGYELLTPQPQT